MKVKPAPGLKVRDPVIKQYLPDKGMEVDDNDFYYIRRLNDGDVVRVDESASVNYTKDAD